MDARIRQSLHYSLLDGIFASIMIGISETFISPYALAMGASAGLVAMLVSLPNLAGSVTQVISADLVEHFGSRKVVINTAVLLHALIWMPIIAIPYLFGKGQALILVILYTVLVSIGNISFPPWSSLMADHVPENERGKVFGFRNRIFGFVNVSSMLVAGGILYCAKSVYSRPLAGFTVIFAAAFAARIASWNFLRKMHEPTLVVQKSDRFTFLDFVRRMKSSNFGRFVAAVAVMNFAVNIAGPFFAVYMLRELRFDYMTYTVVLLFATLASFSMMRLWGYCADHVGNLRILKATSLFLPVIPVLWLVSANPFYLVCVQIFAGFIWGGFNLSVSNFIYDAVTPPKRIRCISYFSVINGFAVFSGAFCGARLVNIVPQVLGSRILFLFLLSGIIRFMSPAIFSTVKEVRLVGAKKISNLELFFSVISRKPIVSALLRGDE